MRVIPKPEHDRLIQEARKDERNAVISEISTAITSCLPVDCTLQKLLDYIEGLRKE
jgi:hypothetical protein